MAGQDMDIHEHGVCVDKKKYRVKCNHCGKEMQSWSRLKCHLGSVGHDVTPCDEVSLTVREMFHDMVMKEKPSLTPVKRVIGEVRMGNGHKRGRKQDSSSKSVSPENVNPAKVQVGNGHKRGRKDSSGKSVSPETVNTGAEANKQDLLSRKSQMSIGRFFYEFCIDFSAVDSPFFEEMLRVTNEGGGQIRHTLPNSHDLNGWMLQETLKEVQDHVKNIKESWAITGCSILLDAWVDQKGRDLVAFVADCPAGPVYLISFDVTGIKNDVNALTSVVDGLLEEVGVHNVIQIIACSTSGWVGELGKSFAGNNNKVFWSVSISHCFELMLVKIGEMDSFGGILDKVNNISEFVNNNPAVWKLFEDHSNGIDMAVSSSEFEFVMPYLTLENIFKAKNKLAAMFASSDCNKEGIKISKFMKDSSFWESVERLVKSTSPLIRGLLLLSTANNQHLGYIYDTMDGIKDSIAREFNHEELCYKPLWDVIDEVWNKHLHSHLHVTGYFLNPAAFYSTDFNSDPEVTIGFISSLVRIVKECHIQAKISTQLEMYTLGKDCFNEASHADLISEIAPAEWWAQKASQCPELQSFAIKILSQTCEGASRYKLKRSLAEQLLLTEGLSRREKKHLEELAFVHYNLHLQSCKAKLSEEQ
ncbi:unnamed protein product [Arabis nemorensis]|uniref:C2H2-type domain-containing protein n=1 Tax=Arabis nemorensis TaxID=586526 RepID=A0A565B8I3_9BRAS|nr:unnamed protein product [Arabis nemorensis]